ncbi:PREDICTED: uncharacterized protein LOC105973351 [Erythranthe guttata]|uniref:uncharacterized protein LOC105973351 n=1 Tax=Erythranthe guttata TaxID=4155 RepID=UPI00064DB242|nr:PREDICTED: uncharacterized protein LOC105973351 [Erythranthe guttata]|eukprot:XP_012853827.1 PREDICTED: uncharacterized protein LOC105973351 [Erythranthe guttata]
MVKDSLDYERRCEACQLHANFIYKPPEPLHPTVASWPFDSWGLDIVGPISSKSSAGRAYILAATDYFSKWAEVVPLKEVKKETWSSSFVPILSLDMEYLDASLPIMENRVGGADKKRLEAQQQLECYQARMSKAFNKKVRPRSFQVGDLVLAVRRSITLTQRMGKKFTSKWDGPYVVKEAYTSGAYKLVDNDGLRIGPINGKFLKRYYP